MDSVHIHTGKSKKTLPPARPLSLLVSVIQQCGGREENQSRHMAAFRRLLRDETYEDFLDMLIDEWGRIKYSTALSAAYPPSPAELKTRLAQQKARKATERNEIEKAKLKITSRILDLVMPNKKPLAKCTGAECIEFGGLFTKIGERVGPNRIVGAVLTNRDIANLFNGK